MEDDEPNGREWASEKELDNIRVFECCVCVCEREEEREVNRENDRRRKMSLNKWNGNGGWRHPFVHFRIADISTATDNLKLCILFDRKCLAHYRSKTTKHGILDKLSKILKTCRHFGCFVCVCVCVWDVCEVCNALLQHTHTHKNENILWHFSVSVPVFTRAHWARTPSWLFVIPSCSKCVFLFILLLLLLLFSHILLLIIRAHICTIAHMYLMIYHEPARCWCEIIFGGENEKWKWTTRCEAKILQ